MPAIDETKFLTQMAWDDVPHITEENIRKQWNATPVHLRRCKRYGEPVFGEGRIYEYDIETLLYDPFPFPPTWPRVGAIDPAWNRTAALWCAFDETSGIGYYYGEYYESHRKTELDALSVKTRCPWCPYLIDPASVGTAPDGRRTIDIYRATGINVVTAQNPLWAGIRICRDRMFTGRLKVSRSLKNFAREFNMYHQKDGKIPKGQDDHLMDCMRYIELIGREVAACRPGFASDGGGLPDFSMGGDSVAGY